MRLLLLCILIFVSHTQSAQIDSTRSKKCRRIVLLSGSGALAGGSLVYLNQAWFKQYSTGKFHPFNDNAEWMQMDKIGHAWTTYNVGRLMMDAFDWAGFTKKQKLLSGTIGFAYMTGVELMDGFSSGWGFSWGDMAANAIGSGLAIGQEALWNEQRIFIKYSYRESGLAQYNPGLLGKNIQERILKDYNAQTYWLSFSPFAFCSKDKKVPRWLALSFGYGAYGMIYARTLENQWQIDEVYPYRRREYYLSLDINFNKIKTKSKVLKTLFTCINTVKVPFPSVVFTKEKPSFRYFN